jgi:hypothetical protein
MVKKRAHPDKKKPGFEAGRFKEYCILENSSAG